MPGMNEPDATPLEVDEPAAQPPPAIRFLPTSYPIENGLQFHIAEHVVCCLPFLGPLAGSPAGPEGITATLQPTFACGLCRIVADSARHMAQRFDAPDMAAILAQAPTFAWSFEMSSPLSSQEGEPTRSPDPVSLAAAVTLASAHMIARHGYYGAVWHTVDVVESFPGTAYGAVILRGLKR